MTLYGIGEWYGECLATMSVARRRELAAAALGHSSVPACPFQKGNPICGKKGGVCAIREYEIVGDRISKPVGGPVITCPNRFAEGDMILNWLANILKFDEIFLATEVPFMKSKITKREAGRIDLVLANDENASDWSALEIQAVYFSGSKMEGDFKELHRDSGPSLPQPSGKRRPDWRSSSAKRLMPQLEVKSPTLRRWGKKLAVAVDLPFFQAIGGISDDPVRDVDEGDIIWLVPRISSTGQLEPYHWEVLTLEETSNRLLSAASVGKKAFELDLRSRLFRF